MKCEDANNYDEYDVWGRLNHISYPDGSDSRTTYDDINSTKTTIDRESKQILETYDLLNSLTKKELVRSTGNFVLKDLAYDYSGDVLTSKDGKQHPTTFKFYVLRAKKHGSIRKYG